MIRTPITSNSSNQRMMMKRGRRMRCHEALKAQGMRPNLWKWQKADGELFRMAGNAMNLNVIARVICALYPKKNADKIDLVPKQQPKQNLKRNTKANLYEARTRSRYTNFWEK